MTEVMFTALRESSTLEAMSLDDLTNLNTELSKLRERAGGDLRNAIYEYALEVNRWLSTRSEEREQQIKADIAADPERAAKYQSVDMSGFKSDFDKYALEKMEQDVKNKMS